jgi:antitoxin ParD1/3/4
MDNPATVKLSDHDYEFAQSQVEQGLYPSVDDVVSAGLRMVEHQSDQQRALEKAIDEGDASGPPEAFDLDQFLAEMHASIEVKA